MLLLWGRRVEACGIFLHFLFCGSLGSMGTLLSSCHKERFAFWYFISFFFVLSSDIFLEFIRLQVPLGVCRLTGRRKDMRMERTECSLQPHPPLWLPSVSLFPSGWSLASFVAVHSFSPPFLPPTSVEQHLPPASPKCHPGCLWLYPHDLLCLLGQSVFLH